MATFVFFEQFAGDLADKVHDLLGTNDTLKVYLSNTTPDVAADAVKADMAEITPGNGYTSGGDDTQNNGSRSGDTLTVTATDIVVTASGAVGPFRYAVLYNDTPTSPADPLIGYWDYASSISLANGETFTVDFGASLLTIQV
jgi:hypothetical protein